MELLQLKYFADSARTENFSVVANKYLVPVSSVSSSVRKLERELGCNLFDRNKNRIKLNNNGKEFYNDINTALNLISNAKEKISQKDKSELGSISILIRTKKTIISEKIIAFMKKNKNISFHLAHNYSLANYNDYDIIIDEHSSSYKGYLQKPIVKEKIKIAASKQSPLCSRQLILKDLEHMPFISMSEGSSLNKITKEVCQSIGFNPKIIIESDDNSDIKRYIQEDFGIAFVSEKFFIDDLNDEICFLNVVDFDYNRVTYIYLNNNIMISQASRSFFDYMDEIV